MSFTSTELYAISLGMDEWIANMRKVKGVDLSYAISVVEGVKAKAEKMLKEGDVNDKAVGV